MSSSLIIFIVLLFSLLVSLICIALTAKIWKRFESYSGLTGPDQDKWYWEPGMPLACPQCKKEGKLFVTFWGHGKLGGLIGLFNQKLYTDNWKFECTKCSLIKKGRLRLIDNISLLLIIMLGTVVSLVGCTLCIELKNFWLCIPVLAVGIASSIYLTVKYLTFNINIRIRSEA